MQGGVARYSLLQIYADLTFGGIDVSAYSVGQHLVSLGIDDAKVCLGMLLVQLLGKGGKRIRIGAISVRCLQCEDVNILKQAIKPRVAVTV